jgi:hypothetical protein
VKFNLASLLFNRICRLVIGWPDSRKSSPDTSSQAAQTSLTVVYNPHTMSPLAVDAGVPAAGLANARAPAEPDADACPPTEPGAETKPMEPGENPQARGMTLQQPNWSFHCHPTHRTITKTQQTLTHAGTMTQRDSLRQQRKTIVRGARNGWGGGCGQVERGLIGVGGGRHALVWA